MVERVHSREIGGGVECHYPLSTTEATQLRPGDRIVGFPLPKMLKLLSQEEDTQALVKRGSVFGESRMSYELGGGLTNFGETKAQALMAEGETVDIAVSQVLPEGLVELAFFLSQKRGRDFYQRLLGLPPASNHDRLLFYATLKELTTLKSRIMETLRGLVS